MEPTVTPMATWASVVPPHLCTSGADPVVETHVERLLAGVHDLLAADTVDDVGSQQLFGALGQVGCGL